MPGDLVPESTRSADTNSGIFLANRSNFRVPVPDLPIFFFIAHMVA